MRKQFLLKLALVLICAAMTASALFACAEKAESTTGPAPKESTEKVTNIPADSDETANEITEAEGGSSEATTEKTTEENTEDSETTTDTEEESAESSKETAEQTTEKTTEEATSETAESPEETTEETTEETADPETAETTEEETRKDNFELGGVPLS